MREWGPRSQSVWADVWYWLLAIATLAPLLAVVWDMTQQAVAR